MLAGKFLFSHGNHKSQYLQIFDCYGLRDSLLSACRQRNRSANDAYLVIAGFFLIRNSKGRRRRAFSPIFA
ncbi:MAG: hypothetical protein LBU34_18125 [Planctomycetaceae bacterium]|nr:hypothetical protein [Planctomycetaceae bacterium]